ncbi:RagB/SusD family nutrient uptake outer membrane protein [Dyadobacter psychrotolerans]|uniref:RagB/SusD family nutrient uptake outer membrane protein n=1 Tax=Dyadobacter psychrotolerans TaxID=2541721 RepID=A0A4R5DX45_9BACT|nr:RagB/SusD family nutrient uptake outer membrane protein [Dyadobacter psychrotolerans]TDE17214.1 RagB/SusD family nutrient uptake outer membrane protein [Dyadobacter psychrotolerans]
MKLNITLSKVKSGLGKLRFPVLALALLTSCDPDLLDTEPYGSVASGNMWTTDNLTNLGMTGVYHGLRLGINTGDASNRELYHYDRLGMSGQPRGADAFLTGTVTVSNGTASSVWSELYEGIHRANDAIKNIALKSPSSAEKKARYTAEAKFLRAYYYFRLNQLFKGVPVYLEPVSLDELTKGRETEEKVWEQVIADLTDAINEPALPLKYAKGNTNFGHVTKGAAYALRGKAYMYTKQWQLAVTDFQNVKTAGYKLFTDAGADSYRLLFKLANEQSDEMIFSIQHMDQSGYGSTTQFFCGNRSSAGSCWNIFLISPDVVELYENKDGSKFNWDKIIPGYSAMPVNKREVYFLRNNLTAAEITAMTAKGLDMSLYLPTGNEQRVLQAYENRDLRLKANVITPYSDYNGITPTISRWPYRTTSNTVIPDLRTDTGNLFYYLHRKFVYEGAAGVEIVNRAYGPIDFPLIRYADVLLMWAEALNELGSTTEATALVNEVRARAGIALLNSSAATTVTGQADLRQRIRNERRVEFVNEGIDYFDELRWQSLKESVFYTGNGVKQIWGTVVTPYIWQGDYLYKWPVPQVEIERNSNLLQNPGWQN